MCDTCEDMVDHMMSLEKGRQEIKDSSLFIPYVINPVWKQSEGKRLHVTITEDEDRPKDIFESTLKALTDSNKYIDITDEVIDKRFCTFICSRCKDLTSDKPLIDVDSLSDLRVGALKNYAGPEIVCDRCINPESMFHKKAEHGIVFYGVELYSSDLNKEVCWKDDGKLYVIEESSLRDVE